MIPGRWYFILLALAAYSLPWASQQGAALTFNAYDLAEWTSLNPVVRAGEVPFAVTFGLRIIPVLLLTAFVVDRSTRQWERLLMTAIIAVALLPPLMFFTNGMSDPNHRQQLIISILALLISGLSITVLPQAWRQTLQVIMLLTAAAIAVGTLITALDLMRALTHAAQPGTGGIIFVLVMMIFVAKNSRGNLEQATS